MREPITGICSVLLTLACASTVATPGYAQQARAGSGRALGVGFGLGSGAMAVGDDSKSVLGASAVGRLGIDSRNRFLVVAELQPLEVDSPVFDESFKAINVLLAFSLGSRFKVRPGLGIQFRSWSGSERVETSDAGLLLGLDAGPEFRLSERFSLSPEVVFRFRPSNSKEALGHDSSGCNLWPRGIRQQADSGATVSSAPGQLSNNGMNLTRANGKMEALAGYPGVRRTCGVYESNEGSRIWIG